KIAWHKKALTSEDGGEWMHKGALDSQQRQNLVQKVTENMISKGYTGEEIVSIFDNLSEYKHYNDINRYIHEINKQDTDILSPLDNIKTLPELLELIPPEYHKTITRANERAEKAFDTAKNRERKEPKELVDFVNKYYNIEDYSEETNV